VLGLAYPLRLAFTLFIFAFPSPRKHVVFLLPDADEVDVQSEVLEVRGADVPCDTGDEVAEGGRSRKSDLERSCVAGAWRNHGAWREGR
jgi:hypothetical protein